MAFLVVLNLKVKIVKNFKSKMQCQSANFMLTQQEILDSQNIQAKIEFWFLIYIFFSNLLF